MPELFNRAKMTTTTTGTGTITLGTALPGFQSFAAAGVTDGDQVRYVIEDGTQWEIGTGTYTASGALLSRSVEESSNSDAAIGLSGSAVVFIAAVAADWNGKQQIGGSSTGNATTSGTSVVATGIPAGVQSIAVILDFVSTNGTAAIRLQAGDSGGLITSGYLAATVLQIATTGTTSVGLSTGFCLGGNAAGDNYGGVIFLERRGLGPWWASYSIRTSATTIVTGTGYVSPTGDLDRIALVTDGVDVFDNGSFDVFWRY